MSAPMNTETNTATVWTGYPDLDLSGTAGSKGHATGIRPSDDVARAREVKAWDMRIRGADYATIAKEIGVTEGSARQIIKRVRRRYSRLLEHDVKTERLEMEARIDHVIMEAAQAWHKAKEQHIANADATFLEVVRRCLADIRTMKGLDAPSKTAQTDPSGEHSASGGLLGAELSARVSAILAAHQAGQQTAEVQALPRPTEVIDVKPVE